MSYVRLGVEEREEIRSGLAQGWSERAISRLLNRSPSTVSREILRLGRRADYSAVRAHNQAQDLKHRRRRVRKLAERPYNRLRLDVLRKRRQKYAPQQISGWLQRRYLN